MGAYHVAMRQRVEEEFVGVMNAVGAVFTKAPRSVGTANRT